MNAILLAGASQQTSPSPPAPRPTFEDAGHMRALVDTYVRGDRKQRATVGLISGAVLAVTSQIAPLVTMATQSQWMGPVVGGLVGAAAGYAVGRLISAWVHKNPPGVSEPALWIGFIGFGTGMMSFATAGSAMGMGFAAAATGAIGFACGHGASWSIDKQVEDQLREASRSLDRAIELDRVVLRSDAEGGKVEQAQDFVVINGVKVPRARSAGGAA